MKVDESYIAELRIVPASHIKKGYPSWPMYYFDKSTRWVKATELPLPIIANHKRLHVKYKGNPEILVRINNTWFWFSDGSATDYPLVESSLEAMEWLYEGQEHASDDFEYNRQAVKNMSKERDYFLRARDGLLQVNAELVKAAEALMKIDFHDEICVMAGDPYGVCTMELVKSKAKMDGAIRKAKL